MTSLINIENYSCNPMSTKRTAGNFNIWILSFVYESIYMCSGLYCKDAVQLPNNAATLTNTSRGWWNIHTLELAFGVQKDNACIRAGNWEECNCMPTVLYTDLLRGCTFRPWSLVFVVDCLLLCPGTERRGGDVADPVWDGSGVSWQVFSIKCVESISGGAWMIDNGMWAAK